MPLLSLIGNKILQYIVPVLLIFVLIFGGSTYVLSNKYTESKHKFALLLQQNKINLERSNKIDIACNERAKFVRNKQDTLDKDLEVIHKASKSVSTAEETNVMNMELPDEVIKILDPSNTNPSN